MLTHLNPVFLYLIKNQIYSKYLYLYLKKSVNLTYMKKLKYNNPSEYVCLSHTGTVCHFIKLNA